jgi:hypothetical protein
LIDQSQGLAVSEVMVVHNGWFIFWCLTVLNGRIATPLFFGWTSLDWLGLGWSGPLREVEISRIL